ncbi:ABC transporter ATP-binding protein [Clostridium botulinum]|uniref:Oligopeptide ABC transporter, ATP-binding protein n=1 Tax=Clostridium botulinum (strain Hall / ATCC 3502 / NCTC 13319 / Type A) TaxID=441771 RepID=A5I6M6_CLOBH|nr:oligopeptide/dipeptide ABC transporter ATP-binding protein [Clostridium botulinum]EPS49734.1 oligopeptide/dipeptide ABC transporter ATP-binding protein [Clostridium botulinum CFSAN002367]ABS33399.1 oligopeptide/dipeptide ABC transporter, ATP-binding protein [Clostridium botulinum A str. ATCC 19397]ABS39185.1 oligopeptide/dipeptide ABC transporter, ATP-binding protein [Clostridium botulinum A str. Hall]AWB18959.1 ABC transporter ATP-binding protein [Clostridium botulinum]AWB31772.1 ABC trans
MENENLIEVRNLKKYFKVGKDAILKAVDGVSFDIRKGETLGLVGESGCGKTTCGRTILGLYEATEGEVRFEGINIHDFNKKEKREFTKEAQIIFQDPYASLNPRMTVADIIGEGIDIHEIYTGGERLNKIYELLSLVGLNKEHASRFPHEFSGGQRQRIGIARALAIEPKFIVCDEPISALDVSIQAQVVNLLIDLQNKLGLTYLFIAHDLSMVRHISDRVGVMYLGNVVELSNSKELYEKPLHPYTKALLSAIPVPDPKLGRDRERIMLHGEVPSPINPKPGCKFAARCKYAKEICKKEKPKLKEIEKNHFVDCHLFD